MAIRRASIGDYAIAALLITWSLAILFPVYNLLVISLSTEVAAIRAPILLFPNPINFTSYRAVLSYEIVLSGMFNTFILIVVGVPYAMFVTTSLAYSLSKNLLGMKIVSILMIATLYFGGGLIPYYLVVRSLGLINTRFAMILPYGASVFYVIILRNFFQNIPKDIEESAYIDGAKDIRIYASIVLPMSTPILVTIGLFIAVTYWNEWWNCLLFVSVAGKQSLQLVLRAILMEVTAKMMPEEFDQSLIYNHGIKAAVVIITTLPVAALYPFLQRYFVRGLSSGALKF